MQLSAMTNTWIKKQTGKWIAMAAIVTPLLSHPAQAENIVLAAPAIVTVQAGQPKYISPDLFGIFFEDLNYAADGGLYAELVQNRSFEYSAADSKNWNSLTAWELVQNDGTGSVVVETNSPLNAGNPHYAVLTVENGGNGVGLRNAGFDGIVVKVGEKYDVALFAREISGQPAPIIVRLESKAGTNYGEVVIPKMTRDWARYTGTIKATGSDSAARLVVLAKNSGALALDEISLFPRKTFHGRANGLRPDLAQVIADLHPKFMRFPGGCLAHGDGLDNMYRWKDTIGPVEQRKGQPNIWRYHQSVGLGYFEYFQFCEDIGAKPLPVVAAGVCCQNSGYLITHKYGIGQKGLPMELMPAYVQDVLDLIEWANGPVTSTWGAKRAAAGHPKPFNLEYLGVGNEDAQTDVFRERFKMIYDAVKAKHPEITVIGTVGPDPAGSDYDAGWKFANEQHLEMVDEHGYKPPQWFWENLERFDAYDRTKPKVYLGEYAAHETDRANTLRSALAEAAYMTALERNGDIVRLASYAPLLANERHTQWRPDMIYFNNTNIVRTVNYYVQQLFGQNQGEVYLPTIISSAAMDTNKTGGSLSASCVKDSKAGDLILKLVNANSVPMQAQVNLVGVGKIKASATRTVLAGDPRGSNTFENSLHVVPTTGPFAAAKSFNCNMPAWSLTVIRMKTR
jgi:alpha-N-arabinofuranosidase